MEVLDDNFKRLFEYIKINQRQFDFFDIIPPKEVLVSKWIEFILNPEENGVGNLPVSKLLELIDHDRNLEELEFQSIATEVSTNNQRRIDILAKYNGLWIVIENKIDSYENNEQTNEYYNYVESIKEENEVIYLYLKPNYNNSTPLNKFFQVITYNQFINKLKEISEFDFKEKEKYKYLKEFIISGGRFMNQEEIEITDSLKFYINNIQKFERITNEYKDKNKKLLNLIANSITDTLNEEKQEYQYSKNTNTYIQFYKDNWKNEHHTGVHFELLFQPSDPNILGKKVNVDIVIHIEKSIIEEDLIELEKNGITKKGTLAYYHEEPIKKSIELDFTFSEKVKQSIDSIISIMKEYQDKYEEILDKCLS